MRRLRALLGWASVFASLQCGAQARREPLNASKNADALQVGQAKRPRADTPRLLPLRSGKAIAPAPSVATVASAPASVEHAAVPSGLPRFDAALRQLNAGTRDRPVRVAWFGDSHTAADFLTGEVRRRMQARFGAAGPGFFHVGNAQMRHDDVRMDIAGKWRARPVAPAGYRSSGDLRVGLGGLASVAGEGAKLKVSLPRTSTSLHWELIFGAPSGRARFDLTVGSRPARRIQFDEQHPNPEQLRVRSSGLLSVAFDTLGADNSMQLKNLVGGPEFYGLLVEAAEPGIVVDTYGINGARIRTVLSWLPEIFIGELKERAPELVVLSYGTNEAGDNAPFEWYKSYYEQVLERVHQGAPNAECLLVGPTDRQNEEGRPMRRAEELDSFQRTLAGELGCAYFSLFAAMGGGGGFANWMRQRPQLAASDGVHLTISGYQRLGDAITQSFLSGWDEPDDALRADL